MEDMDVFESVVKRLQEKYPERNIVFTKIWGNCIVNIDGQEKFATYGYNLLFNLKRLIDCLDDELL